MPVLRMQAREQEQGMAISIDAGDRWNSSQQGPGLTVPPAAVWSGGKADTSCVRTVRVRTLDSSNAVRFEPPYGIQLQHRASNYLVAQAVGEGAGPAQQGIPSEDGPRSIIESAKQWAGGAVFGLAIFVGILLSQQAQEEPITPHNGAEMVGVSLNQ